MRLYKIKHKSVFRNDLMLVNILVLVLVYDLIFVSCSCCTEYSIEVTEPQWKPIEKPFS